MNKIRTPRGPRNADRSGLCHVSEIIQRLLAMYGIAEHDVPAAVPVPVAPPAPVPPSQQTFAWFSALDTHA